MALTGENLKFLQACFKEDEWDYLQNLPRYAALMAAAKDSMEDAEQLASIGTRLISEWNDLRHERGEK